VAAEQPDYRYPYNPTPAGYAGQVPTIAPHWANVPLADPAVRFADLESAAVSFVRAAALLVDGATIRTTWGRGKRTAAEQWLDWILAAAPDPWDARDRAMLIRQAVDQGVNADFILDAATAAHDAVQLHQPDPEPGPWARLFARRRQ
jgi:hypothetical protein